MKFKKVLAMLLATTMIFSMAACGKSDEENASGEVGGSEGQYLNTYLTSEPTTLDPSLRSDTYSSDILMSTLDGLIRIEQENGEYKFAQGDAESWEVSEDGLTYTFKIGADRKWSDGEVVTAGQYVYSLQRSADPKTGCPNSYFLTPLLNYDAISKGEKSPEELGIKAIDDTTLEITLSYPMASFMESLDGSIYYPQRQDIIEQHGEKYGTDVDTMVFNGPFVLSSWTHNSSIELVKNENYWDKDKVKLEKINFQIMSDTAALSNAFESGQIDVIGASSAEQLDKYKADESLVYTQVSGGNIAFGFYNIQDELFSNLNVRKAFTLAIDREDINDMGFRGLREPLYGWVAPALGVDGNSLRDTAGDTVKLQQEELAASGKTPKDVLIEGMKELGLGEDPSTLDVTYSLGGTSDWYRTFGEYLQQVYKETLGIDMKIDFADWSIFSNNLDNGNYQIGYMAWGAYFNDPYDMLSIHLSNSDQLRTGWKNSEYDTLTNAGITEIDPAKRMENYIAAEKVLLDEYVTNPVATSVTHTFTKSYVHNSMVEYGQDQLYFIHPGFKYTYIEGR